MRRVGYFDDPDVLAAVGVSHSSSLDECTNCYSLSLAVSHTHTHTYTQLHNAAHLSVTGNRQQVARNFIIFCLSLSLSLSFSISLSLSLSHYLSILTHSLWRVASFALTQNCVCACLCVLSGMESGKLRVNTELFASHDASLFVLQHRFLSSSLPSCPFLYVWVYQLKHNAVLF